MPLKINAQTILSIADGKIDSGSSIQANSRNLVSIVKNISLNDANSSDANKFKLRLQGQITSGISCANRLLDDEAVSRLNISSINALERFAILHFASVQRSFLKGLENFIQEASFEIEKTADENPPRGQSSKVLNSDLQKSIDAMLGLEIPYTLSVNPIEHVGVYYREQIRMFCAIIDIVRRGWSRNSNFDSIIEIAMREYGTWITGSTSSASLVRSYLNYEQQNAQRNIVADDVRGLSIALQNWLSFNVPLTDRKKEKWDSYRKALSELPDEKNTMFDENFGVRKVFVQPLATYKVAGVKRGSDIIVPDVAGLMGTLISSRTDGDDLILLAGGPGSGKSTLCRILASELAGNEIMHPIFLRLRRVQESHDIRGFIESQLQSAGLIDKVADLSSVPNLVLILDGFDELVMASRSKLREFFNALKEDLATGPLRHAKAIVSGRDTLFPNGAGLPMGAHVISLQPFDRDRIAAWSRKWRDQHFQDTAKSFYPENLVGDPKGRNRKASPLEHLVSWPLTLHLVARAHTSGSIDLKPENANQVEKAVLYRQIVYDTALRQEDQAGGRGRLNPKQMRKFVQSIAWEMYSTGREALDVSEGLPILRSILPEATESDLNELADVTIVNQPELTKGEETGFEFVHKSFSEYFAAERIATKIEEVCFKVDQWGHEEKTWRMSIKDATEALSGLFAIRLLTAEVQDMLEPMLDDFIVFSKSSSANNVNSDNFASNMENKIERFEQLIRDFSTGESLRDISLAARLKRPSINDLESFANYAAALLFIAVALVKRNNSYSSGARRSVKINAASFVRILHVILSGDTQLDWAFSQRAFVDIDVRRPGGERTELPFPPLQPNLLKGVNGLDSLLEDALIDLERHYLTIEIENLFLKVALNNLNPRFDIRGTFRRVRYDYHLGHGSPLDYIQRIITPRRRNALEDTRYIERRILDLSDQLQHAFDESIPSSFTHEMIMRLRDVMMDSRYRGMNTSDWYERAEEILIRLLDSRSRKSVKAAYKVTPRKNKP